MVKRDVFEWDTHNLKIGKREGLRRMREKERERGEKERERQTERDLGQSGLTTMRRDISLMLSLDTEKEGDCVL